MALDSDVAVTRFDALPEPAVRDIMLALPTDACGRAACVCRWWRDFLSDPSLWQVLDLTPAGGVAARRVTENLVRGAVARAAGQLRVINYNSGYLEEDLEQVLIEAIQSGGAQLEQLNTNVCFNVAQLAAVCAAAPRLQVLSADVSDRCPALVPVLRNDPPFGPVRVSELLVWFGETGVDLDADVLALAAAVASHESLKSLYVADQRFARGSTALVDAAAERQVSSLTFGDCAVEAETIPALARLLQRGSLIELLLSCDILHAPEESMLELCAALRSCRTLTHLDLRLNQPGSVNRRVITALLDAAATLPALARLDLSTSRVEDKVNAGCAFGALLRANLPSLRMLRVSDCHLGDEGMAALLDGLAANTHLRKLGCRFGNDLSETFNRDRLTPALAALAARGELDD
jgi:hypothetical protein